jgi:uncharacterized protein YpbB
LVQQSYSLAEIARLRRLKESTIEDHIIELALSYAYFDIHAYVGEQTEQEIIEISQSLQERKLKPIRLRCYLLGQENRYVISYLVI